MLKYLGARDGRWSVSGLLTQRSLSVLLIAGAAFYVVLILAQDPGKFLQFTLNGIVIGAIYAMVAMGFTLVYGTVWFFDLSYGAMATIGGYTVFYLSGQQRTIGRGSIHNTAVDIFVGALVAGVVAWVLYTWLYPNLRNRFDRRLLLASGFVLSILAGGYTGFLLSQPLSLNLIFGPVVGVMVAILAVWLLHLALGRPKTTSLKMAVAATVGLALGAYTALLLAVTPGANLYLSWVVGAAIAGATGLALYRGLYFYLRRRASSPLIMLVGSLGVLLTLTALVSIVFSPDGRPLPPPFGETPWRFWGASIKPFQVFNIGFTFVVFAGLVLLLFRTSFGKAVRAIGDDEEVARIVGINAPVIIAVIFALGAAIAATGGILLGEDLGIKPTNGLVLLLKGWVAAVVGGIGNIYGAILGGFVLGMVENYGVWFIPAAWKDAIAFGLLILFLSFWSRGLLPRK